MTFLSFLFIAIFILATISLHLSIILDSKKQFDQLVRFFLIFVMFHVVHAFSVYLAPKEYAYIDRAAPFGLLYGPLLYFVFLTNQSILKRKTIIIHGIPFLIGVICYLVFLSVPSFRHASRYYYSILYGLMALSWLIYPTVVYFKGTSISKRTAKQKEDKTLVALVILFTLSFFMLILVPTRIMQGEDASLSTGILIFLAMFTTVLYVYIVNIRLLKTRLQMEKKEVEVVKEKKQIVETSYQKSLVQEDIMRSYYQKVNEFLNAKHYLDAQLSLDTLSSKLKIPRHHVSQLFSQYYGESFTKHINSLRIQHACKILEDPNFHSPIDDLVEICGFSSKTSFYRNFREITNMTPSEFLDRRKNEPIVSS